MTAMRTMVLVPVLPPEASVDTLPCEYVVRLAATCDVVVTGTPIDLGRLINSRHPIRHARYELQEIGTPTLEHILAPLGAKVAAAPALV
jgi:predicted GTPase